VFWFPLVLVTNFIVPIIAWNVFGALLRRGHLLGRNELDWRPAPGVVKPARAKLATH
jgi:hypothetical protein